MKKQSLILGTLLGVTLVASGAFAAVAGFPDVEENHWAAKAVEWAKGAGLVQGYPDGTFKGNNNITRYETVQVLMKHHNMVQQEMTAMTTKIDALQKQLNDLQAKVNNPNNNNNTNANALLTALTDTLKSGANVQEMAKPNLTLPTGIDAGQIKKYFKLGDLSLALVLMPSMNIYLEDTLPKNFSPTYAGVLIANKGDTAWSKLVSFKDTDPNTSSKNNPYYLWTDAQKLMLSLVDQNGGGSGEGMEKVYSTINGSNWNLEGCYYFGTSDNNPNFGEDVDQSGDPLKYSKNLSDLGKVTNEQLAACKNDVTLTTY